MAYHRSGSTGTLKLSGSIDINIAGGLNDLARRALADAKAKSICLELSQVEHFDVSALQVLCALARDVRVSGRSFHTTGMPTRLAEELGRIGITLSSHEA
jgi:anti-anti-sigma factor